MKIPALATMSRHHRFASFILLLALLLPLRAETPSDHSLSAAPRRFIDAETALAARFGEEWRGRSPDEISAAIVTLAESLPVGGAIDLPRSVPCGVLDFRRVADRVQVTGGRDGTIIFGGGQSGLELMFSSLHQEIAPGLARPIVQLDPLRADRQFAARAWNFKDIAIFDKATAPASDLFALFNHGSIKISADVKNCAWLCGENAFGARTVTADARVDDSLFLWFGINWNFADYNAHWYPKNAGKDWVKSNTQLHFNLHGGGQGTRLYEMIETSYGNPGPNAVFENAKGLAIYHGSTERGSSQGPGVYHLKNCEGVQLGLRGINAFGSNNGDTRNADANRDITIEGGRGNILHAMRTWSNPNEISLWNSDPALQLWMVSSQYGHTGTENALRFAVTPYYGRPTPELLAKLDLKVEAEKIFQRRAAKIKTMNGAANPDSVEKLVEKMKAGRHMDAPFNATDEETFLLGKTDLAKGQKPAGKLPAPPSVPAVNAPRTRRPIAFTQQPEFGQELLALGADPTGKKPCDDAFAQLLYGLSRDQLQTLIDEATTLETDFRKLRDERDTKLRAVPKDAKEKRTEIETPYAPKLAEIKTKIADNWTKIGAKTGRGKGSKTIGRVEISAGTFYLKRPLYLLVPTGGLFGAGPDKTVLKTDQPIPVIKMQVVCTIGNFSVTGGHTGLALTGSNHDDAISPVLHSYIAGQNFYNITFRDQTFAGMHIGNDEEGLMGGSEHDQNKYVDLKFLNTGRYGIYFNVSMLDKWLCLHGEFSGQKKAGIACQFNNLIHGCVVDSSFRDIDGPAIDFFGGNVEIGYRPWEVWIDGCEFTECGSAQSFAVEQGLAELSAFTHSKITTKKKTIAGGYAGSPQICEDNVIDVKLAPGAPAMKLRAVRTVSVARANGHVFRDVTANGPVVFVNDAEQHGKIFDKTKQSLIARGKTFVEKWDTNPMAHELAPKNGWVHPFIFYRCEFNGEKHAYSLLNVDVDKGAVKERGDLSKFE